MNMKRHITRAEGFAHLMENQFSLFGIRFGLDSILGLLPGAGDVVAMGLSLYLLWIGHQAGLAWDKKFVMVKNILVDFLIGGIPILGDFADIFYKANTQNLAILKAHIGDGTTEK